MWRDPLCLAALHLPIARTVTYWRSRASTAEAIRASLLAKATGHDVMVCSREQSLNPPAEWRIFLGETWESRARPMDQQHPQITVTALSDVQQPRFSTCRRLTRHQSQPSCQITTTAERLSISHRRHKGGRRQHPDPRDPDQSLGSVLIAYPFGEFIVKPFDPPIDASPLLTHVLNEPPKAWSKTIALVSFPKIPSGGDSRGEAESGQSSRAMLGMLYLLGTFFANLFKPQRRLEIENLFFSMVNCSSLGSNRRVVSFQIYDPVAKAAVADLADIPAQSRGSHRRD